MGYFIQSLKYVRPHWRMAATVGALMLVTSTLGLLAPWPLKILVDNVLDNRPLPESLPAWVGGLGRYGLLAAAVIGGLLLTLLSNMLTVLNEFCETTLEQRMVLDFRGDLFQHAQRLSLAYHDNRRSGMLIYAINFQGDAVAGLVMTVPALGHSLITLIGMVWITLVIDPVMAGLSLLVVPFLYFSARYYATHIQQRLIDVKGMEGQSLSIVHEAISMLRVIVAFGRENYEYLRFRNQATKAVKARVQVTVRQTLFSLVVNMTTAAGTAVVLGFGAYRALAGALTVGDLLVVLAYIAAVYQPLESITHTIGSLQNNIVSQRLALNLLNTQPEVKEAPEPIVLHQARGAIEFEDVGFNYRSRRSTLTNISFAVEPGQRLAIVGPTGAGKTTLISLMTRFYDPQKGRILLDGIDIRDLSLKSLRDQFSLVMQEPLLFSGTIAENIRYGRPDATDDDIVEAARAANSHDFILRLPKQYETELGERGAKLSGGERQRICIARAFIKSSPILILDEPTSSIDSRTEAVILDALDTLMIGRTSFIIAHRLSTIHQADTILVLDQGKLVEHGSHQMLLERQGLYRQLHDMQNRQPKSMPAAFEAP